jgi:hypothetical protein
MVGAVGDVNKPVRSDHHAGRHVKAAVSPGRPWPEPEEVIAES